MVVLLTAAQRGLCGVAEDKATEEVMKKLREGYDKALRPPGAGGTEVQIQLYFRNIDIDDVNMKAYFDITFRMLWNDSRLAYENMPGASNVEYVPLLDPSPLWLPDPFFKNGKLTQYKAIHPELYFRVYPDGNIVYSTRVSLHQSCPMNLKRFPHDTQVCDIKMASYGYTTNDQILKFAAAKPVVFGQDIHADKFRFEDYFTDVCHSKTSTGEYSCIQVSMKIRRVFGTYLLEWYFPCMFLVIVAWFSFLVPTEQFLGRLLVTLIPLITLSSFSIEYKKGLASVPYFCAMDNFTGISVTIIFLTLLYVILCNAHANKKEAEKAAGSPEDGEIKTTGTAQGGWLKRTFQRIRDRAEYFSRVALISAYVFFLFVYFVAFCGTG